MTLSICSVVGCVRDLVLRPLLALVEVVGRAQDFDEEASGRG